MAATPHGIRITILTSLLDRVASNGEDFPQTLMKGLPDVTAGPDPYRHARLLSHNLPLPRVH